jgi:hypothetical protein
MTVSVPRDGDDATVPVVLAGGTANRGQVFRVGGTVRRPSRPTSRSTRALLTHLQEVGFDGAPRFLGFADDGREILSYLPGDAPTDPYPAWALTDDALASVARLMRRFHSAVAGFDGRTLAWQRTVPARFRSRLVSHNDPNLDNVVFRGGEAVALIDFDLAAPGSTVWDLAIAARLWCPLRDDDDVVDCRHGRSMARLRVLLDEYGASAAERERLPAGIAASHRWSYALVRREAERGHPGFRDHWVGRDAASRARRSWRFYADRQREIRAACGL